MTATLDLKAEKSIADPYGINSVQFSPDGKQIVSGGGSGTLKVWDAANPRPYDPSEWEEVQLPGKQHVPGIGSGEWDHEKVDRYWKNNVTGWIQESKPSAGAPVVGTLKVWDAGER